MPPRKRTSPRRPSDDGPEVARGSVSEGTGHKVTVSKSSAKCSRGDWTLDRPDGVSDDEAKRLLESAASVHEGRPRRMRRE